MTTAIDDLKARARILHRRALANDSAALARLGALDEPLQRRHCLAAVAKEAGFRGWSHAAAALTGTSGDDFGELLYPRGSEAHWNVWSASYDEARGIRQQHGGYLLAYRRHFFIADEHFIATLGLDPADPDWETIGRDWVQPRDAAARDRLYLKLFRARLAA